MPSHRPPLPHCVLLPYPDLRYSKEQVQAELDDVQEQLRKEEETRGELEDNIKGLRQEMEVSRTELALAKVNIGVAGAVGGAAVSSAVDSARLAELESLLDARTRELAEMGDKWVPGSRGGGAGL